MEVVTCDRQKVRQIWTCADHMLRPTGTSLNLNFGNVEGGDYVVVFQGTGPWSKWQVFGEANNICLKQKGMV